MWRGLLALLFPLYLWAIELPLEVPYGLGAGIYLATPTCPREIRMPYQEGATCATVCDTLIKATGGKGVVSKSIQGNQELNAESFRKLTCTCHIAKELQDGLLEWELTCVYVMDIEKKGEFSIGDKNLPKDIPTRLVRLFTFSSRDVFTGEGVGDGALRVILSGFYSIYAKVIEGFTYTFALYLVVIISFWNFLLPAGIAFGRRLKEGHVDFTPFISGELVQRTLVIIPAVAFFSLPVPTGGINFPAYSIPALLNLQQIGPPEGLSLRPCEEAEETFRSQCESQWENTQGQNNWLVLTGADTLKVPVALALVREFVLFGVGAANNASKKINAVILTYQELKTRQENRAMQDINASLKEKFREHEQSVAEMVDTIVSSYSQCFTGGAKGCENINDWNYERQDCPGSVHKVLMDMCNKLRVIAQEKKEEERVVERKPYGQLAQEIQESFGWLSPAIISQVAIYSYFSNLMGGEKPPVMTAELVAGPGGRAYEEKSSVVKKESDGGSWWDRKNPFEDKSLRFDSSTAFMVGQALGVTSIPPFSFIKSAINNGLQQGSKFIENLANLVSTIAAPLPFLSAAFKLVGASVAGIASFAGSMVSLYLSYVLSMNLLKLLPFFVVTMVTAYRFLGYLFDLAKFIISLPFFAVGAATRNPASTLAFFAHTIKLTGVPLLITFMPLVAFVGIELSYFFLYEVPVALMLKAAGKADAGILFSFIFGVVTGVLYVVVSLMNMKVAWTLSNGFIEGVFSYVSQLVGHYQSAGSSLAGTAGTSVVR